MDPGLAFGVIIGAYLIGSISFTRLVSRWVAKADVTEFEMPVTGTGESYKVLSIGANAASLKLGPRVGCAIGLLDMLKVILPILFLRSFYPEQPYFLLASAAGAAGHNWPIYHRFRGGRGFSVIFGSLLVVDWLGALVCVLSGLILGFVVLRNIAVAYMSWLVLIIPWMWFRTQDPVYVLYATVMSALFFIAMIPDFKLAYKYHREGRLAEYQQGAVESTPMGRGFVKMAAFFSPRKR